MTDSDFKATRQRILTYAKQHWQLFGAAISMFIIGSAVEPVVPWLFKKLLDSGFQDGLDYPLWMVPVVVIGLFLVRGLANYAGNFTMNYATSAVVLSMRQDLMRALVHADASVFTRLSSGQLVAKVVNEPQSASSILGSTAIGVIRDFFTLVFLVAYLFYLNWQLTLLAFISMPLLAISVRLIRKRLQRIGHAAYHGNQRLVRTVDDNARAWRVVRTFDAADFEMRRFDEQALHQRRMLMKQVSASSLITPTTQVIAAIGVSFILMLALHQASQGGATVGEFVSFLTALLMTISPLRHLTDVIQPLNSAMITLTGAFQLFDAKLERDDGQRIMQTCQGGIDFKDAWVHYEGAPSPALQGFNLRIAPGQTIALVGASGAGKSTVVNTLLRFSELSQGRIELDGTPITELKLASLRQHFAVVSQDIILFDGTVAENVAYASKTPVDRRRVEECLRAANLWTFVSEQPSGLDTEIGTNGSKLSGGQRQRLAIARALYRDAAVWIFDEATSALDSESEAVIQRSIQSLRGSKTLILIAHRLSTIRNADQICVMSEGRIAEQGPHDALVERNGLYASLVRLQATT